MEEVKNKLLKYCFECKGWVAFLVGTDDFDGGKTYQCAECLSEIK